MFRSVVVDHWLTGVPVGPQGDGVVVAVDASLAPDRCVSLLDVRGGPTVLRLTPERARDLSLAGGDRPARDRVLELLGASGVVLTDPDHVFHLPVLEHAALRDETVASGTRPLTGEDAAALARLSSEAPADEVDEAFVELDHWLVMGAFADGELAAAGSAYPWGTSGLADLGVITLPRFRGRGLGRATVRAMSAAVIRRGLEPQYRCRTDNAASIALAASAGFAHFGDWRVIAPVG